MKTTVHLKRIIPFLLACILFLNSARAGIEPIPSGSFIINMGVVPQTYANGLKPWGMIWDLIHNYKVQFKWIISQTKAKDGTDFTYNGVDYKGGSFIILAKYRTPQVEARIAFWQSQGVVGVTTTSNFNVDITYTLKYTPRWTFDFQNGSIALNYLTIAGIPTAEYPKKYPDQLDDCDDLFVMPHADPTWPTHHNLMDWNHNTRGWIWYGCHAGSVVEDLTDPNNTSKQMNFLTKTGLVNFSDHNNPSTPFSYRYPNDPEMQFMGTVDAATTNGSEQVYLPLPGGGWRPGAKVSVWDPTNNDVPSKSPGDAAIIAYGRAYDNISNGKVMFQAGHNFDKGNAASVSAIRAFFNFSFMSVTEKEIVPNLVGPLNLSAGNTYSFAVSLPAGYNNSNYSFHWTSACGGKFSSPFGTTTNFTPDGVVGTSCINCRIIVTVTDKCGREFYQSADLTVCPTPPIAKNITTSVITNAPGTGAQNVGAQFPLAGTDADGYVVNYNIKTLPTGGKLYYDNDNNASTPDVQITSIPTGGLVLTKAQSKTLKFDPDDNYNGNASFQYSVTDNSTLESIANATYTIPINTPPVAKTFICTPVPSNGNLFSVCPMQATDLGTIVSYTVMTLPPSSECTVYLYGSKVTVGQVLTPTQASQLTCIPSGGYMGYAEITYTATDDMGASDPKPATLTLQFVNQPPVPADLSAAAIKTPATASMVAMPQLQATDIDGTVVSYTITNIPASSMGTLYYNTSGTNYAPVADNTVLTIAQSKTLKFTPVSTYSGMASFRYTATDDGGLTATTPAKVRIPVASVPPVANDVTSQAAIYTGAGMTSIKALSATEPDATSTLVSYIVTQLPPANTGILYYNNGSSYVPVVQGGEITLTQGATLKFAPAAPWVGTTQFNYTVKDSKGLQDPTPAKFIIPVTNQSPKATDIAMTVSDIAGTVTLTALSGTDPDGSIASYVIINLPDAKTGTLYYNNNLVTSGTVIVAGDAGKLQFVPVQHNNKAAHFKYTCIDNMGARDADGANYTINIQMVPYKKPPKANDVTNPTVTAKTATNQLLPMDGYDSTGVITSYIIASLPKATQGQLYVDGLPAVTNQVVGSAAADQLTFVPTGNFVGNATFNYQSVNGDTLTSNSANFTVPVINNPPVADNINLNVIKTNTTMAIAPLRGSDADGSVVKYQILTAPNIGVLQYDKGGNGTYSNIPLYTINTWYDSTSAITGKDTTTTYVNHYDAYGNIRNTDTAVTITDHIVWTVYTHNDTTFGVATLTAAQSARLKFVTSATTGTTSFTYVAIDNLNAISNVATYTIPVDKTAGNQAPVANNITSAPVNIGSGMTAVSGLNAMDVDGTIASYTIQNVPPAWTGKLYKYNTITLTYDSIAVASYSLTPAEAATLKFVPANMYVGNVVISYTATDNLGGESDPATLTIPIADPTPTTSAITNAAIPNNSGPAVISALTATAPGGLNGFVITALPSPPQGKLILDGAEVPLNQVITAINANRLEFDPDPAFIGNATFKFAAVDNFNNTSSPSTFTIPVTNTAPVVNDVKSQVITNVAGIPVQAIPALDGYDNDGTINSFIIKSLPANGTLFKNGTAITSVPVQGVSLTPADAAKLSFAPNANASGIVSFTFIAKDNNNNLSTNTATYQIPLNLPPVATNKTATAMGPNQQQTSIPALTATDDGSVVSYSILSLPSPLDGQLYLNNVAVTSVSQVSSLTPAQVSTLSFKPSSTFAGTIFTYTATDDMGIIDVTPAVYTIPYNSSLVVLPLNLLSFSGAKQQDNNLLTWTTSQEMNVSKFDLEYSTDGSNYQLIASVQAKGNSSATNDYSYVHQHVIATINYYRLRMWNTDGSSTYSNVVLLKNEGININLDHVYPNPFADELNITISSSIVTKAEVFLLDMQGRTVRKLPIQIQKGTNSLSFQNLQVLGAGTYIVSVKGEDINFTAKVVKAK